jgi:hypothetical protein
MPLDQRPAADRLLGSHIVLDDGAQDLLLTLVQLHVTTSATAAGTFWHSNVTSASLRPR